MRTTLPYHAQEPMSWTSAASVEYLSPVHFRRRSARPVSYYALFKWWLLLSQHPGCHRLPTSFRTEHDLGTLTGGLGCFPLVYEAYPSQTICPGLVQWYSEFGSVKYPGKGPHPIQYLYPRKVVARGYPSRYFGENELSPGLITLSVLPTSHPLSFQPKWVRSSTQFNPRFNLLMGRSPGFASTTYDNVALLTLGFPMASARKALTEPQTVTRRIIMQKARRHTFR